MDEPRMCCVMLGSIGVRLVWIAYVFTIAACAELSFTPPDSPLHDEEEDDWMHARRSEYPFLCGDPGGSTTLNLPCPDTRPLDNKLLSCDSVGCHGNFDYTQDTRAKRHLHGSDGPSCYTCHDVEWEITKDQQVIDSDDDD
jgi:hypothetical protein